MVSVRLTDGRRVMLSVRVWGRIKFMVRIKITASARVRITLKVRVRPIVRVRVRPTVRVRVRPTVMVKLGLWLGYGRVRVRVSP